MFIETWMWFIKNINRIYIYIYIYIYYLFFKYVSMLLAAISPI